MKIYQKITNISSFGNQMRAEKYLEKVKKGFKVDPGLRIFNITRTKDDTKKFRVGFISRLGKKSNGRATISWSNCYRVSRRNLVKIIRKRGSMSYKKKSNYKKYKKAQTLESKGFFRTTREAEEAIKKSNLNNYRVLEVKRKKKTMKRYCVGRYV